MIVATIMPIAMTATSASCPANTVITLPMLPLGVGFTNEDDRWAGVLPAGGVQHDTAESEGRGGDVAKTGLAQDLGELVGRAERLDRRR